MRHRSRSALGSLRLSRMRTALRRLMRTSLGSLALCSLIGSRLSCFILSSPTAFRSMVFCRPRLSFT